MERFPHEPDPRNPVSWQELDLGKKYYHIEPVSDLGTLLRTLHFDLKRATRALAAVSNAELEIDIDTINESDTDRDESLVQERYQDWTLAFHRMIYVDELHVLLQHNLLSLLYRSEEEPEPVSVKEPNFLIRALHKVTRPERRPLRPDIYQDAHRLTPAPESYEDAVELARMTVIADLTASQFRDSEELRAMEDLINGAAFLYVEEADLHFLELRKSDYQNSARDSSQAGQ
jgi:hypothetical protein